jgi:hypothetical protein
VAENARCRYKSALLLFKDKSGFVIFSDGSSRLMATFTSDRELLLLVLLEGAD